MGESKQTPARKRNTRKLIIKGKKEQIVARRRDAIFVLLTASKLQRCATVLFSELCVCGGFLHANYTLPANVNRKCRSSVSNREKRRSIQKNADQKKIQVDVRRNEWERDARMEIRTR